MVERLGDYRISKDIETKNVYIYWGEDNILQITRVYSTEWLCTYEMVNYPFDTQVKRNTKVGWSWKRFFTELPDDFHPGWDLKNVSKTKQQKPYLLWTNGVDSVFCKVICIGSNNCCFHAVIHFKIEIWKAKRNSPTPLLLIVHHFSDFSRSMAWSGCWSRHN